MFRIKVDDISRRSYWPAVRSALRYGYCSARRVVLLPREIHADDRGAISVLSVFSLLVFTFLLVMIVNVATHLDDKVRMQNTADAAAHSSGVVLSRGMNAITFSNHLLCDVFAITAYLREARDRQGESFVSEILDEWETMAQRYSSAEFEKYQRLGSALTEKVPLERDLSSAFGELNAAAAEHALPVMESVLEQQLIPKFQYTVIRNTPELAQQAAYEVAVQNGLKPSQLASYPNVQTTTPNGRSKQTAVLWHLRDDLGTFTDENDPNLRNMPVVDPTPSGTDYAALQNPQEYFGHALTHRQEISKFYLEQWIGDKMRMFDQEANLSQHNWLFRIFAAGQLDKLLKEDYPDTNIPVLSRLPRPQVPLLDLHRQGMTADANQHIDDDYHFLVVIYRDHVKESGPGVFRNPLKSNSDAMAFSQFRLFLPRPRWRREPPLVPPQGLGGSFGFSSQIPARQQPDPNNNLWYLENWPTHHWDVFNQNWTVQLVPATSEIILPILQTEPTPCQCEFNPPKLDNVTMPMIRQINTH